VKQISNKDKLLKNISNNFPPVNYKDWITNTEQILGEEWLRKLTSKTDDGIEIKPLYHEYHERISEIPNRKTKDNSWDVMSLSFHPDPKKANKEIIDNLENGANSLLLRLDPSGRNGTVIRSIADLDILLDNVYMEMAPINLEHFGPSLPSSAYLMSLIEKNNLKPDSFQGNFGVDPLSTLAETGQVIVDIDTLTGRAVDLAYYVKNNFPNSKAFNINSRIYHEAGCTEAQELAITIATAVYYLREMTKKEMDINIALDQIAVSLTCDSDVFLTMAKFRSMRKLWSRIAECCGGNNNNLHTPLHALTAPRMISKKEPWVNVLRCATACFGAGLAGADSITVLPLDFANGYSTELSRRIARNTQIILQEEAFLEKVIDPVKGSYLVESLSNQLSENAWTIFQNIEKSGGIFENLKNNSLQKTINQSREKRYGDIAKRKIIITGINDFPYLEDKPASEVKINLKEILEKSELRAEKANNKKRDLPIYGKGNLMKSLVQAAGENVSISGIGKSLKGSPTKIKALGKYRLSEEFENLRFSSDNFIKKTKNRPKIFNINFSQTTDYKDAVEFAEKNLRSGGLEIEHSSEINDIDKIVEEFKKSAIKITLISQPVDMDLAGSSNLARKLKKAGAKAVYLNGEFSENEILNRSEFDGILGSKTNTLKILESFHKILGTLS